MRLAFCYTRVLFATILFLSFLTSCGRPPEPPVTDLVYQVTKTLNNGACGSGNACVELEGVGQWRETGGNIDRQDFRFDNSATITLTISTSRYVYPGEPPVFVNFTQVDRATSRPVGNHNWNLRLENLGTEPKNTFVFEFMVSPPTGSGKLPISATEPVKGLYILGSSSFTSSVIQVTARKTVTGKTYEREISCN